MPSWSVAGDFRLRKTYVVTSKPVGVRRLHTLTPRVARTHPDEARRSSRKRVANKMLAQLEM